MHNTYHQQATADTISTIVQAGHIGSVRVGGPGMASVPLSQAVLDLTPAMDAILPEALTGRQWVIDQIDHALAQRESGFVWVEGPAGIGKSAMAAELIRQRGWLGHFARLPRGGSSRVGLQNLAGQLIRRLELRDWAPGGMLPEYASTPEGFAQVLSTAAQRARERGERVVLVVDGADEAEPVPGCQPWGLPLDLPTGVFVVGTYRSGYRLLEPAIAPVRLIRLDPQDQRNQHDVIQYLNSVLVTDPELVAALANAAMPVTQAVEQLAARTGGVWVYLRYVLDELRTGALQPAELAELPHSVAQYYVRILHRWKQQSDWDSDILPVLATLAVTAEPLPTATLALLADVTEHQARECCYSTLRPFLATTTQQPDRRHGAASTAHAFQIYHDSLRELISAPHRESDDETRRYWAEILSQATASAQGRVVDHYLALFGGLAGRLAVLGQRPALASRDGGYPLRHLASHLLRAGRAGDLHALLGAEAVNPVPDRVVNVWFAAHQHADSVDNYLADIDVARQHSQAATDHALARHQQASTLALEIRYWLITASVASPTTAITTQSLVALLGHKICSPHAVLAHAMRITDPATRASTLTQIASHLPDPHDRRTARAQVLEALAALADESDRVRVLVELSGQLEGELLAQALDAAVVLTDEPGRARALAGLAGRLEGELLTRALDATVSITNEYARALVLVGLTDQRTSAHKQATLAQALDMANSIVNEYARARALAGLAGRLEGELLTRALDATVSITNEYARALVLVGLTDQRTSAHKQATLAQALDAAAALMREDARAEVLVGLAGRLEGELLARGVDAAISLTDESNRARVLVALANQLEGESLTRAVDATISLTDESNRARVLVALANQLEGELLTRAVDATISLTDESNRARVLVALANQLEGESLTRAVDATISLTDESNRARVLVALANQLEGELLTRAVDATISLTDESNRARVLVALANQLEGESLTRAVDATIDLTNGYVRARTLGRLAGQLEGDRKQATLAQALDETMNLTNEYARARILAALAGQLEGVSLVQAMDAAMALTDESDRAQVLVALANQLEGELLASALDAAISLADEYARARVLIGLADQLDGKSLVRALEAVSYTQVETRIVLAVRAASVCEPREFLTFFRAATRVSDRRTALALTPICFAPLARLADAGFADGVLAAVDQVLSWWS